MNGNTGYNLLDGLRPLKRYLSLATTQTQNTNDLTYNDVRQDVSDWGIDSQDFRSLSSPTLVNADYSTSTFDDDSVFHTLEQPIENFNDWGLSPQKLIRKNARIGSITVTFNNLLQRFRDIELESAEFHDELRFILITSQLLDETILVSKYYNKKKNSALELNRSKSLILTTFGKIVRLNSSFTMSLVEDQFSRIIPIILFLKYLYKNHQKFNHTQIKIFLIVTGLSLFRALQSKLLKTQIVQNTLIRDLKRFIKTQQKLDLLLQRFINKYKELKLFSNLLKGGSADLNQEDPQDLLHLIISSTSTLTSSITSNISIIAPHANIYELENYCGIYKVEIDDLAFLLQDLRPLNLDHTSPIDFVFEKLKKFHYLRRFYLCCVLATSNESRDSESSPFSLKIQKLFKLEKSVYSCSNLEKWSILSSNLKKLKTLGESLQLILNEHKTNEDNNSINGVSGSHTSSNLKTSELFQKAKEFQSGLLFFDKEQHIENQIDEFSKLGEVIESLSNLYQRDLSLLKKSSDKKPFNLLSPSSTNHRDDKRKRHSLPVQQHISPRSASLSPQNYKRLSSGLSVPLLTVLEDEESYAKRTVSYDDNYLNIAPNHSEEPSYTMKKDYISDKNLLSNDDTVVISTVGEDTLFDNVLDENELKKTLESKFARIASTSSALGEMTNNNQNSDDEEEVNFNDQKVDDKQALPLINELRAALGQRRLE